MPKKKRASKNQRDRYAAASSLVLSQGALFWTSFQALLLPHTVFLAVLLQSQGAPRNDLARMLGGILGFVLCVLWFMGSARIWAYYDLRIAQARDSEPTGWDLSKGPLIDKFCSGDEVALAGGTYKMPWYASLPTRRVSWLVIAAFAAAYVFTVWANGLWQPS